MAGDLVTTEREESDSNGISDTDSNNNILATLTGAGPERGTRLGVISAF
jgi:hypothetical protein